MSHVEIARTTRDGIIVTLTLDWDDRCVDVPQNERTLIVDIDDVMHRLLYRIDKISEPRDDKVIAEASPPRSLPPFFQRIELTEADEDALAELLSKPRRALPHVDDRAPALRPPQRRSLPHVDDPAHGEEDSPSTWPQVVSVPKPPPAPAPLISDTVKWDKYPINHDEIRGRAGEGFDDRNELSV